MRYGSVCSGVEAATLAWESLGWHPVFFSEVEPFPCKVLAERFGASRPVNPLDPDEDGISNDERKIRLAWQKENMNLPETGIIPNEGDFTKIGDKYRGKCDLLVGGTPCQSLSVAGKREGFAGVSGLALDYIRLAYEGSFRWIVWENVPGVFSSNKGRDFAAFLSGLSGCEIAPPAGGWRNAGLVRNVRRDRYGLAWRVLDAQYVRVDGFPFAVPQRRRRVFVVGYFGDWRPAAQVLFERSSLLGNTPPCRKKKEEITGIAGSGIEENCGAIASPVASTLNAHYGDKQGLENQHVNQGCPLFVIDRNPVSRTGTVDGVDGSIGKAVRADVETGKGFFSESPVSGTLEAHEDQHRRNILCIGNGHCDNASTPAVKHAPAPTCNHEAPSVVAGFMGGQGAKAGGIAFQEELSPTIKASPSGSNQCPCVLCLNDQGGSVMKVEDSGAAGTLRANTHGNEQIVCFQQNTRDEVRLMNGDGAVAGALMAEPGAKQQNYICYENHATDARIAETEVAHCMGATRNANASNNNPLIQVYSIDALSSNSMKSGNPNSGFHEAEAARTIDTSDQSPCKNQGGQVIVGYYPSQHHNPQESEVVTLTTGNCNTTRGDSPLVQAVAIAENIIGRKVENGGNGIGIQDEVAYTQNCTGVMGVAHESTVRRLTPVECERLMGFPDNHTRIPWRGKPEEQCPDSPRYKACGNSMCVNVMRWIGQRIQCVENEINNQAPDTVSAAE